MAKQVQKSLPEMVEQSVTENSKEVKKPSIMEGIAKAGLQVAKAALPSALSAIPVAGPILGSLAQNLLSTMNDDEWFEEYDAAGATFNEMLKADTYAAVNPYAPGTTRIVDLKAACGVYPCRINMGPLVKENVFPALLAFIRSKTQNVLVENTDRYWFAMADTLQLYAIYYNICKYLKLSENLPLNAPTLPEVLHGCDPVIISQLAGIRDSLRDFLKQSTGAPYAMVAYLRWRYGTIFRSENSARAGLISYDIDAVFDSNSSSQTIGWTGRNTTTAPAILAANLVGHLTNAISKLKNDILYQGRANADIALAFRDHQHKYDVEEAHYDEKEFNLRCNLTSAYQVETLPVNTVRVLMDSRLKTNTAIQSVTISTIARGTGDAGSVFIPSTGNIFNFNDSALIHVNAAYIILNVFNVSGVTANNLYALRNKDTMWAVLNIDDTVVKANDNSHYAPVVSSIYSYDQNDNDKITFENGGLQSKYTVYQRLYILSYVYRYAAISLQMHYNDVTAMIANCTPGGTTFGDLDFINSAPLSYDIALITDTQLESIQRQTARNLFRGTYSRKSSPVPEVAETVSEVVEAATV